MRTIEYKILENGNIRGFQPTPDKRGVSECQYQNPNNIAQTVTTAHEPKIYEMKAQDKTQPIEPGISVHPLSHKLEFKNHWDTEKSPALRATDYKAPHCVKEPKCEVVGKLEGGKWDKSLDIMKRVYGENGIAPTQHCVGGGNMECKVQTNFRIRKLTERECFRLMDVSESDIDKIQAAKISRTQQYKMASNSIVVACLEGIFRRMFVDTEPTELKLFY